MEALAGSLCAESRLLLHQPSTSCASSPGTCNALGSARNGLGVKPLVLQASGSVKWITKTMRAPVRCEAGADGAATLDTPTVGAPSLAPALAPAPEEVPIEKRFPSFPTVLDINKVREILPHRFPFLLVDRVIEYNPGVSAVAIKNVTINDNFFPGHFPERPIMPGVLMVEAMAQVGGIVMLQPDESGAGSKEIFYFAGVDKVRWRKPVVPGDTLVMRMNLIKYQKRFGIAKLDGKAYVGEDLVCEGEFLLAIATEKE